MDLFFWSEIHTQNPAEADVCVMGIPFDGAASVGKGAALGPDKIRECSRVLPPVSGTGHRFPGLRVYDRGNEELILDWPKYYANVEAAALALFREGKFCLFLGGDHSVTIPLSRAFGAYYKGKRTGIIHFDSHPDLCEEYEGSKWSHACPLKRALDDVISPGDLAQVGIRSYESEEVDLYEAHPELLVIKAHDVFLKGHQEAIDRLVDKFRDYDAVYLTLDIDVLDPAFAPGTGTPEAGGLSSRELLEIIGQLVEKLPVKAMDVVEVSPPLDTVNQTTSWAAVKIIYEVFAELDKKRR